MCHYCKRWIDVKPTGATPAIIIVKIPPLQTLAIESHQLDEDILYINAASICSLKVAKNEFVVVIS